MLNTTTPPYKFWWKEDTPFQSIVSAIKWLDSKQGKQYELNRRHLQLYGNRIITGLGSSDYIERYPMPVNRLTLNVIQSVIDAATSQISTNKPKIMNLTDDGDWAQQQRAKKMDKWTQGIFYETNAYDIGRTIFRDACIFGTGMLKVIEKDGRASIERVFVDDLLVDDRDSRNTHPRQIFEVREISRDVLLSNPFFEKYQNEIMCAGNSMRVRYCPTNDGISDLVSVAEAFHLPSSADADDGRHVICLDNCDLLVEEWNYNYFPYARMRWGEYPLGYWGWGIAEQLTSLQTEINYILQKIQRLMTIATSQLWIRKGNSVDKNKLTNEDWAVREYAIEPPVHLTVQSVSPEYFTHLDRLYNRAYEITGVNQLTAQSQKPAGLNSGVALDSFQDSQTKRFMEVSQRYDEMFVHLADMLADKTREIAEREGSYKLKARGSTSYKLLDWSEVEMDREDYIAQPYPTSFFPQTPSGKWNQIQEMMSAQFLSHEEAAELLDYPDLSAVTHLRNAPIEYVRRIIQDLLDGKSRQPDAYSPVQLINQMLPLEILKAEQDGAPDDRIELLRRYLSETMEMVKTMMPQPSPQQAMPQAPIAPNPGMPQQGAM